MTQDLPLMPKATAVWLVDNTTLTFRQIADFTGMHELEIAGIADGEVAIGIKGFDPILNNQLTRADIKRCEGDSVARLKLIKRVLAPEPKKKAPRYTPVSKRQERPQAIAWLVRYHPEMEDSQIAKLVGSTKPTIQSIRDKTHWNSANLQPVDPVALGLCTQIALDAAVQRAAEAKAASQDPSQPMEAPVSLMPVADSLAEPSPALPSHVEGFESFTLEDPRGSDAAEEEIDADALFNLPKQTADEED